MTTDLNVPAKIYVITWHETHRDATDLADRLAPLGPWRGLVIISRGGLVPGANPRFIVTSLSASEVDARTLYKRVYCARGDMENRICPPGDAQRQGVSAGPVRRQDQRCDDEGRREAGRRPSQLRLWFASMAYVLIAVLRRIGSAHSRLANATCGTLRLKLLKIGA